MAAITLVGAVGCQPIPEATHGNFGYDSIRQIDVDVQHTQSGLKLVLVAELATSNAGICPDLDPTFAVTANGVAPEWMGLYRNDGDAIVYFETCRIHQLGASFILPADTRTVRIDLSQGQEGGSLEFAAPEQSQTHIGPLSAPN